MIGSQGDVSSLENHTQFDQSDQVYRIDQFYQQVTIFDVDDFDGNDNLETSGILNQVLRSCRCCQI